MATVTVEGEQFKTYPQTFNSQVEAEEALAGIIVKKLGILGGEEGGAVRETQETELYADRVVQLIGERQNGVWSTQIEKQYQDTFGERLPSLWFQEVEAISRIRVDCPIPGSGRYIVFPVCRTEASPDPDPAQPLPPLLPLPEDDLWDVFITFVRSTSHISLRLIGEEFSERFEDLSSNMDLHYYDKAAIPRVAAPEPGRVYAAQVSSDWHRVKVLEVRGIECTCWFLDHGDEDRVPVEDLREIAPKFLDLPAQAIAAQLAGLEDYEHSEAVVQHLNNFLLGKSLVAKVENRLALGITNPRSAKPGAGPRIVLFDTSSDDVDVNLNQKLLELLVSQDSSSKLPQPGGEEITVFLSYVSGNGDISVQRESSTFTTIEKMIVEQGPRAMETQLAAPNPQQGQLYLAKYSEDGSLYRAEVRCRDQTDPAMLDVYFVDYGNCGRVPAGEVWELSAVSEVLAELPRQALSCRLAGLPPAGHAWSEEATRALRDLVPESQPVTLKVTGGPPDCPQVEIHLPNSKDGSVNLDLSTDFDIFPLSDTPRSPQKNGDASQSVEINGKDEGEPTVPAEVLVQSATPAEASPLLSTDLASLKTLLAPDVPAAGEYFDVNITFAVSPSNFVVQPYNEGPKLELLMTELNAFYTAEERLQEVARADLTEGSYFAAQHTDGFWYRVRVTRVIDAEQAAVRFVDYGDLSMVSLAELQPLWGQFRNLPYQAINARLAGCEPTGGDWRPEDTIWFNTRVADKQFVSLVKGVESQPEPTLFLTLIDTSHPAEDKFVDQELVQAGRAVASQI